jgi:phosphohistidine phosphatase
VRLWLLRHAKSSWEDPGLDDVDRPLASRGERAAARMRDHLGQHPIRPALVLCSSARRTRQTLAAVLPALGTELEVRIEPWLYTFDAAVLLDRLARVPDATSVLLVGHNPALEDLATLLAGSGQRLPDLQAKFPTCALAEIDLPSGVVGAPTRRDGVLMRFVLPRELGA